MNIVPTAGVESHPLDDPDLDRPRSWWDDPRLSLDALSPGQRYTAFITLALAVALMAFGIERGEGRGLRFEVPTVAPLTQTGAESPTIASTAQSEEPRLVMAEEPPTASAADAAPSATTTTSPRPTTTTQPPNEEAPGDEEPGLPLPPLPGL